MSRYRSTQIEMDQQKKRVETLLLEKIRNSGFAGNRIPGEHTLSVQYGVGLRAVRSVIRKLCDNHILEWSSDMKRYVQSSYRCLAGKRFAFCSFVQKDNPAHSKIITTLICNEIESLLIEEGATLELVNLWTPEWKPDVQDTSVDAAERLAAGNYDGIFAGNTYSRVPVPEGSTVFYLESNFYEKRENSYLITYSNRQTGREIADYFWKTGHRKIGALELSQFDWSRDRISGMNDCLERKKDAEFHVCHLKHYTNPVTDLNELDAAAALLTANGITAVYASNDAYALALIRILQANGIGVPEDISVIGTDDSVELREFNLTTVKHSPRLLAQTALDLLKKIFSGTDMRNENHHVEVECPLIVRQSTKLLTCPEDV